MAKVAKIWDGTDWVEFISAIPNPYPDQNGNANKYLTTDGTFPYWADVVAQDGTNSFATINTPSGTDPVADSSSDTLNITASNGMVVTGDSSTDTVNFSTNATSLNTVATIVSRDSNQSFDITAIDFDTADTISSAVGRLTWDDGEGTLNLGLKGGNLNLRVGQENTALCYNGTGSTITKGSVVYISGAQGQRPSISLADADSESTSSKTFGVAAENISNDAEGFVCTFGIVENINTSTFTAGQALWLSSTAGQLTNTKPTPPVHSVFVGYCLKSNSSSGRIFITPQNGYELDELHNVLINGISDNHIISYDNATSLWKNQALVDAIKEVDGTGSGIDSDLLDSHEATYFLNTSSAAQTKAGDLTITGNLTVSGTTTTINSTVVTVDDKNIELGAVDSPTDITADGGGIILKGDTDKTVLWSNSISSWTFSDSINLTSGSVIKIAGTSVLSATQYSGNAATVTNGLYSTTTYTDPSWLSTLSWSKITNTPTTLLGYGIIDVESTKEYLGLDNVENTALSTWVGSTNITTLGTITSGTWNGSVIADSYIASAVARLAGPTFTGTVVLPGTTSIGEVTSTEISYLDGVTSAIQTQINNKLDSTTASSTYAPINSPTFTGTADFTSATVLGIDALPSQTGNAGKYLKTNGSSALWEFLNNISYSSSAPSTPSTGDVWIESDVDVNAFDPHQYVRWIKILTGSQSVFSGVSSAGILLEYTPGFEQVFLNGSLLLRGTDYTATDGATVTLTTPAVSGNRIEIIALNVFSIANVYTTTEVDNLLVSKAALSSPTFTGTPAAPTASAGTNTTQIATTAFVRTEVSNLIASAPAALDTLDELAAALGDDASFATTVTNSLAAKAPIASPTFTGTVTAGTVVVTGMLDVQEIREALNDITLSSNVGTLDWTTGNVFFIGTAPTGNMTFNITNVPTDNGEIMSVTVFVTQGSTGYIPSTLNINGSSATIKWVNGTNPVPTSQAGKIDIFAFSLIRRGSAWTVLGSSSLNF